MRPVMLQVLVDEAVDARAHATTDDPMLVLVA